MKNYTELKGVDITTATSTEEIISNIVKSTAFKHKEIYELDNWREKMPIAIVGGGPSLKSTLDILRKYKYILACGSVHDYLVENNIIPNWCIICDPDKLVNKYLKHKNLSTKYLVASQCSEETFDYLIDQDVYTWHAWGDNLNEDVFGPDAILIGGGCTVGTRAMSMALGMGYYTHHFFGMDTCLSDDYKHHAYDFQTEEETIGNITEIKLDTPDSPTFKVAGYMLGQLFDFKQMCETHSNINIEVFGDGLLKHLVDISNAKAKEIIEKRGK